jgi:hypothetical protein
MIIAITVNTPMMPFMYFCDSLGICGIGCGWKYFYLKISDDASFE